MKTTLCAIVVVLFALNAGLILTYPAPRDCTATAEAALERGKEVGARMVLKRFTELERKFK